MIVANAEVVRASDTRTQRAFEFIALVEANAVAEVLADFGADLLGGGEQVGSAVGVD